MKAWGYAYCDTVQVTCDCGFDTQFVRGNGTGKVQLSVQDFRTAETAAGPLCVKNNKGKNAYNCLADGSSFSENVDGETFGMDAQTPYQRLTVGETKTFGKMTLSCDAGN